MLGGVDHACIEEADKTFHIAFAQFNADFRVLGGEAVEDAGQHIGGCWGIAAHAQATHCCASA